MSREELHREVARLSGRLPRTNLKYSAVQLDSLRTLVQQPEINYREIVFSAEHLII